MKTESSSLVRPFVQWSRFFVYAVMIIATLALLGWILNIDLLKRIIPGIVAMNPLTAVSFLLTGIAFIYCQGTHQRWIGQASCGLVVSLAVIKLAEYALGVEEGIDNWLFHAQLEADQLGAISNRMAVNTAFCFGLIGGALWLSQRPSPRTQRVATYLALVNLFIPLLSILGYIYVVDVFYAVLAYVPMALHTALSFVLLSLALLFGSPNKGIMADITSAQAGGILARRVLPLIFTIPIFLGVLILLGQWQKLYGLDFGLALFTVGIILLFLIAIWRIIKTLNHFDQAREKAEIALREANHELATQADRLKISNQELESFSYSVSHDLRAPLRAIGGYAQLLEEDYNSLLDEEGKKMLEAICRNSSKMGQLIDDLLRFSRVGKMGMRPVKLNMTEMAQNTFNELTLAGDHPVSVDIESMPVVQGDYSLVAMLYQNLLSNAIKYSSKEPHPHIRVGAETSTSEGEMTFFVQDNGAGFDMRHYDKLFGVFHRLHKQSDFEGTGVGLAIAQKAVLAHGGRIWAEGTIGEGATFYFTLNGALHPPSVPTTEKST